MNITTLFAALQTAGLPVVGMCAPQAAQREIANSTWYQRPEGWVRVDWSATPTTAQDQQTAAIIAAFDPRPRKPRLLLDILADLVALSNPQKANINTNCFTTRPCPWETDGGSNAAGIVAIVAGAGGLAALTTTQKIGIAALWCQDNPNVLAQPAWDGTIDVAGDELA